MSFYFLCVHDSLWLQHARLPCPSLSPWVCSDSCPLSWWCYLSSSSSAASFSFCLQSFPALGSFESVLRIRWPKYWSFSFSIHPSSEYSGLISFRRPPCSPRVSQESIPAPQFEGIDSSALSLLYCPTLISYMTTGKTTVLTIQTLEILQIQF